MIDSAIDYVQYTKYYYSNYLMNDCWWKRDILTSKNLVASAG